MHVARGRAVSRDADDIVAECTRLADAGVREIILVGINVGSYSSGRLNLAHLLEQLLDRTARLRTGDGHPVRFRLSSIEPMDVDDDLISLVVDAQGRVCRHLHLPLQSGSSKVLREMARPYDAPEFCGLVGRLRAALPGLALTTDVIAGFPGEGDVDFGQTCEVARACAFSKMHVFPYSPRRGTPAAQRDDQVPTKVRADRAARLRALSDELRAAEREARRGTQELAIVLDDTRALTESYFEIAPPEGAVRGQLVPCLL